MTDPNTELVRIDLPDGGHVLLSDRELRRITMGMKIGERVADLIHVHRNEHDRPIDFSANPQWRRIFLDPSPDIRVQSSAQQGKTLCALLRQFAGADLGLSCGWVMPKEELRNQFVNDKVERTINNTPYYRAQIAAAKGSDATKMKHWGKGAKGALIYVGCNSPTELMSFSADMMNIDERDQCHRDNLGLYPSRMNRSPFALTFEISTPTVPGEKRRAGVQLDADNINTELLNGDYHRYYSCCPHCGYSQRLDFYEHIIKCTQDEAGRIIDYKVLDPEWDGFDGRDARVVCKNCERPFDRMIPDADWMYTNPGARIRSYEVNRMTSALGDTVNALIMGFASSMGNASKLTIFNTMTLGMPFAGGHLSFSQALFQQCDRGYQQAINSVEPTTAGIDVNVPYFDIQISRWFDLPRGEQKQVKLAAMKVLRKDDAHAVLKRFNVRRACMDSKPEHHLAIEFQHEAAAYGCQVIRCKYATQDQPKEIVISQAAEHPSDPPRLVTVARTISIDALHASMLNGECDWFAGWAAACDGRMLEEFTRSVRRLVRGETGQERYEWVGKPDHQLHAAVLDRLAGIIPPRPIYGLDSMVPIRRQYHHTSRNRRKRGHPDPAVSMGAGTPPRPISR